MDTQESKRVGVATYVVDAAVAILVCIMGGVIVYGSRKLGSEWTSDGPGSGYFPFYIGLILLMSGVGIFFQALLTKKKNTEVFVDREQLRRVLSVLIPAAFYVVVIQVIGIYVASVIYIAAFMMVLGKFPWWKSALSALAVNTVFFLMFEVWFKVPLFKGAYDPLAFLGY